MKPPAFGRRSGAGGKVGDNEKAQATYTDLPAVPQVTDRNLVVEHWWLMRRNGVTLPAELGVILITGGRP